MAPCSTEASYVSTQLTSSGVELLGGRFNKTVKEQVVPLEDERINGLYDTTRVLFSQMGVDCYKGQECDPLYNGSIGDIEDFIWKSFFPRSGLPALVPSEL